MSDPKRRVYFSFDPANGYPAGENVYYECERCGGVLKSLPEDSVHCECKNIIIDADYGRVSVKDHSLMRAFSIKPRTLSSEPTDPSVG